jgi:hypothetical protein
MRRFLAATAAIAVALLLVALHSPTASAHERRQVGRYVVVVGFLNEPAYVEEGNAASITVFSTDGQPVDGVQKTLKVEVSTGGASRTFDLSPQVNKPGGYVAAFTPTKTGTYVFRFVGMIENQPIDERFESGPNRFDDVVSRDATEFPLTVPSNGQLAADVDALKRASGPTASAPPPNEPAATVPAAADVQRALDRANQARTLGLVVGGIGIIVGLIGVALALRRPGRATGEPDGRGEPI